MANKQVWLSMDPGVGNYAVTVFRYNQRTQKSKLLYCGMLENPIKNLTSTPVRNKKRRNKKDLERDEPSFDVGYLLFRNEIEWLFDTFGITHVAAERFQSRGRFNSGDQGELISLMLGTVFTIANDRGALFYTTIAGVWKKAFEKLIGANLQSVYDCGKMNHGIEPHPLDSTMIGMWHASREKKWPIVKLLPRLRTLLIESGQRCSLPRGSSSKATV